MTTQALETLRSRALLLAGDDYRWTSPNAPASVDSAHRFGLTLILTDMQAGVCAACGEMLAGERTDLCHLVPSRVGNSGVMPGNVYVGHTACNSDDSRLFANGPVPLASLARVDVVAIAHPTRKECVARHASVKAHRETRRAARVARLG